MAHMSLGVAPGDSSIAMRRAYRDLARLSRSSTAAVPVFVQEIELACEVLSDGARRALYDAQMERAPREGDDREAAVATLDLLRDFEGGRPSRDEVRDSFRRNFAAGAELKSARVSALDLWIRVAPFDPAGEPPVVHLALPVFHACSTCHGDGQVGWCECAACQGTGLVEERHLMSVAAGPTEQILSLDPIGVRTLLLRVRVSDRPDLI